MASWEIDVNGKKHTIECKTKFNNKVIIDGQTTIVKTNNILIGGIDYEFKIEDTLCNLTAIGKNVRLAVNGKYLDNNEDYKSLGTLPTWVTVIGISSMVIGMLTIGLIGFVIGALFLFMYGKFGIEKKYPIVIISFIICTIIQIAGSVLYHF